MVSAPRAAIFNPTIEISSATTIDLNSMKNEIKKMEKVELHMHFYGSIPRRVIQQHATPQQYNEICRKLDQIKEGIDYHDAFDVFKLIENVVNTPALVEEAAYELCLDLIQDNVVHAELRTGFKKLGSENFESYLEAILRGIERGTKNSSLTVGFVPSLRRETLAKDAIETLLLAEKHRERGICGIDVSGDIMKGDGVGMMEGIKLAHQFAFPITLHLGESSKEAQGKQLMEITSIQPRRIGHGAYLSDPVFGWVKKNQIPVELCFTSATKVILENGKVHPALQLLKENHPVVICTDNLLVFDTNLTDECFQVALKNNISIDQLKNLQEQAKQYSFFQ